MCSIQRPLDTKSQVRIAVEAEAILGVLADALHLASAEAAEADFFCTCDDRFLKRAKEVGPSTKVVSPLELIAEIAP